MSVREPLGATPQGGAFELTRTALGPRRSLSTRESLSARRGWIALGGLLGTCLVVSLSAAQSNLLLPASVRPLPGSLAGPFGSVGLGLGLAPLIAVFVLMFLSYVVAVRAVDQLSLRAVLISIAVLNVLVLLAPPLLSTDVFSYGAYARMGALYGANPYMYGPSAIQLDPMYSYIGAHWVTIPTAYGPVFTALSYLVAPLSIAASAFAFKSLALVSSLALLMVIWKAAPLRGIDPLKALAFVGLNPVIVVYGVGGGHNDLMMLALLMAGVYVLLQRRERAGGALIVAATAVKLTAGLLLPFAFARDARHRRGLGGRRGVLAGAGMSAATIAVLGAALFGIGPLYLLSTLGKIQNQDGLQSIPGFISAGLGLGQLGIAAELVLALAFVATFLWLLRRVWQGELDWITGAGWATVALLITTGSLLPWYVGWLVPLAALSSDRRLWLATFALTALALTSL
jgi:Glycosyltransferase family 87